MPMRLPWKKAEDVAGASLVVSTTEAGRPAEALFSDFVERVSLKANSTVASASDFWARNLSEPPLGVAVDGETFDPMHPLARLFAAPNPYYSQDELWQAIVYSLCSSDKGAFLLAPLSRAGEPLALWPKSADEVRVVPSVRSFIGHYETRVGPGVWEPVNPDEVAVVWFRLIDPDNKWGSWPPVAKAAREIKTETAVGEWLHHMLKNMGRTSSGVAIEGLSDQSIADRLRDYINDNIMRPHNAEKAIVIAGKASKFDLGPKLSDLDFGSIEDRLEVAIARGFGLAPELLHILLTASAGNGLGGERQTALKRQAYTDTLIPISKMIAAKVASVFAPVYDLDPEAVRFDFSGVQALSEDIDKRFERARKADGFGTVDEQRALVGWQPLPKGSGDFVPRVEQVRYFTAAPDDAPVKMQHKAARTVHTAAVRSEAVMAAAARRVFEAQRKRVMAVVDGLKSRSSIETKDQFDALLAQLEEAMGGEWDGAFSPLIAKAMARGAAVYEAGLGVSFELGNDAAAAAVAKRVAKVTRADETTKDAIRAIVADARLGNATMADVASAIETVFTDAKGYRAMRIARTESIGAANEGGWVLAGDAKSQGMHVVKTWMSFADDRTRDTHSSLDGETVDYDQPFSNGLMFPGDEAGDPEEVINCRCTVGYEVMSTLGQEG